MFARIDETLKISLIQTSSSTRDESSLISDLNILGVSPLFLIKFSIIYQKKSKSEFQMTFQDQEGNSHPIGEERILLHLMALGEFFTSDQMKLKHFTKIKMFINSGQWSIAYMAFHLIVGYTESVSHFTNKKKKCLIYSGKPSNESMLPMHQIVMLHSHC